MQITLVESVNHDGVDHVPGDVIDVSDEQGQSLVDAGVAEVKGGGQSTAAPLDTTNSSPSAPVGDANQQAQQPPTLQVQTPTDPQSPSVPAQAEPDGFPVPAQPSPEQIEQDMAAIEGPSLN